MMGHTTHAFRTFWRLLSSESVLWTEMIPSATVDKVQPRVPGPEVAQLGGSDPKELRRAAQVLRDKGYDEINLNVGCPSATVAENKFGAVMMREPELVAECCDAIGGRVSVKHRLGVLRPGEAHEESVFRFVEAVRPACSRFIVHARVAVLDDSPRTNREVPPLKRDVPRELKRAFPETQFIVNGGIDSFETAEEAADGVDGVMVGRALISHPCAFADVDHRWYHSSSETRRFTTRGDVLDRYIAYVDDVWSQSLSDDQRADVLRLVAPAYHLFNGEPRNGAYMRRLRSLTYMKRGIVVSPAAALRAARAELDKETLYDKPLTDFIPVVPAYDHEQRRAGPLARVVH